MTNQTVVLATEHGTGRRGARRSGVRWPALRGASSPWSILINVAVLLGLVVAMKFMGEWYATKGIYMQPF